MPTNDYSKNIVYLSKEQYQELITNETLTVNGQTITYNENDIYVTPQAEPITDIKVNNVSIAANGVAEMPKASNNYYGVIIGSESKGLTISNGQPQIRTAPFSTIKEGAYAYLPITPSNQHQSVFYGLAKAAGHDEASSTESVGTYTSGAKAAIQSMLGVSDLLAPTESSLVASKAYTVGDVFTANGKLYKATAAIVSGESIVVQDKGETVSEHKAEEVTVGEYAVHDVQIAGTSILSNGVANIPKATTSSIGLVKPHETYGIGIFSDGSLRIIGPSDYDVRVATNGTKPIVPDKQHAAAFYGLAKAAGDTTQSQSDNAVGTYTVAAKTAIRAMLGATSSNVIEVSDTQPTDTDNKIWMPETAPAGIEVPTYAEFQQLSTNLNTNYVQKTDYATSNVAGVIKVKAANGLQMNSSGELFVTGANGTHIKLCSPVYTSFLSPGNIPAVVFYGLANMAGDTTQSSSSNAVGTYTAAAQAAIQNMLGISNLLAPTETVVASKAYGIGEIFTSNGKLYKATAAIAASDTIVTQDAGETVSGSNAEEVKVSEYAVRDVQVNGTSIISSGVANIPMANATTEGIVKLPGWGLVLRTETAKGTGLAIDRATATDCKSGSAPWKVLSTYYQEYSVFYGLAKAAGDTTQSASSNAVGTYTDNAKASIKSMLGIVDGSTGTVTVTGTTPTITAVENTRYVCGEVSTLSITPPASGICIVRFTSGTTAAVVTVPNAVKFPEWFDVTTLDANTIYEMCITDGIYGAVMSWAL